MRTRIDCYLPFISEEQIAHSLNELSNQPLVNHIYLLTKEKPHIKLQERCSFMQTDSFTNMKTVQKIINQTALNCYILLYKKLTPLTLGYRALERFVEIADQMQASIVYADHYEQKDGKTEKHPLVDYQIGSLRNDFDFGPLMLLRRNLDIAMDECDHLFQEMLEYEKFSKEIGDAGLYLFQLYLSKKIYHIKEFLYTDTEPDNRLSGEKQFDYVDPRNQIFQKQAEFALTLYLKDIDAYVPASQLKSVKFDDGIDFPVEASIIIPVFNRVRSIKDAVNSALEQQTDFKYNVIVIDNHSTDGTSAEIERYADDKRVVHLIPEATDLGIGGCWDYAIRHASCGRFAVQLDSDDLYSTPDTLQKIVDGFHQQQCAMLVGSYRMTDFDLNSLPPGIIDHKEWTAENGHNNVLRVNGFGAPRAFYVPVLRSISIPNVSYGEDYAIGLALSTRYKIGRIFDELYLCRRWEGNSDAALSQERINENNLYKDSLRTRTINERQNMIKETSIDDLNLSQFLNEQTAVWHLVEKNYKDLDKVKTKTLGLLKAQFNPNRIISTGADISSKALKERPCFLCEKNRPWQQLTKTVNVYTILVNPYPILKEHFTLAYGTHEPQKLQSYWSEAVIYTDKYITFYNGAKCGASIPDHYHLQCGLAAGIPIFDHWKQYDSTLQTIGDTGIYYLPTYTVPVFVLKQPIEYIENAVSKFIKQLKKFQEAKKEPMFNMIARYNADDNCVNALIFPRTKHRPDCYSASGDEQMLISPGALDMAGLIITPREEDFNKITIEKAENILQEVAMSRAEAQNFIKQLKTL